jgi:hypothetical protein
MPNHRHLNYRERVLAALDLLGAVRVSRTKGPVVCFLPGPLPAGHMDDEKPSPDDVRNQFEDVVVSAELVAHLAPLLEGHASFWKWVIVAAHSALQRAMVCAFGDSTGTAVLEQESAKKMLEWFDDDTNARGEPLPQKLASFGRLLNRCTSGSEPLLVLSPEQRRGITQLHDHFLNDFAPCLPHQGWSIPKAELPPAVTAAMSAVESLMTRCEARLSERQHDRLSKSVYDWRAAFVSDAS